MSCFTGTSGTWKADQCQYLAKAAEIKDFGSDKGRFVRRAPTLDYSGSRPDTPRGAEAAFGAETDPPHAHHVIHFLTDFQDFSTVHFVPHRRHFRALALGLLLSLGCGPIVYMKDVSPRAAAALNQAREDQAEKYAPYEYTKASLYYDKAREEAGHAYYQNAVDWGRRSQDCSRRASALARSAQSKHVEEAARPNQSCGDL